MAIENIQEIKDYMTTNKDNDEVKGYIKGFNNLDGVKDFLETNEDGKKYLNSFADSRVTKGIDSWKVANLDNLVTAKVKELHPDADPKDLALSQLKQQFEDMKNSTAKEKLTNKTLKQFQELKLPSELVDFIVGDEASTAKNIETLKAIFASRDEAIKTELVKGNSYTPPTGGSAGNMDKLREKIRKNMG